MATEEWRPVVGFEGVFEVSSLGRVRSVPREYSAGPGRTRRTEGRVLSIWHGGKYPKVRLKAGGVLFSRSVHTLVAAAFIGPRPEGMDVCHNNGDSSDNRAENLRYDTREENNRDIVRHGHHRNASRTHCIRGHEFTPENTYVWRTARYCRTCRSDRDRMTREERVGYAEAV